MQNIVHDFTRECMGLIADLPISGFRRYRELLARYVEDTAIAQLRTKVEANRVTANGPRAALCNPHVMGGQCGDTYIRRHHFPLLALDAKETLVPTIA